MTTVDFGDYTVTTTVTPNGETQTWTYKPGTAGANYQTLLQRAETALTNNQSVLAQATPAFPLNTAAQQALYNQVVALTRQVDGLIRFLLNQYDSVSDA